MVLVEGIALSPTIDLNGNSAAWYVPSGHSLLTYSNLLAQSQAFQELQAAVSALPPTGVDLKSDLKERLVQLGWPRRELPVDPAARLATPGPGRAMRTWRIDRDGTDRGPVRIGVEVEVGNQKLIHGDFWNLQVALDLNRIDFGILLLPVSLFPANRRKHGTKKAGHDTNWVEYEYVERVVAEDPEVFKGPIVVMGIEP